MKTSPEAVITPSEILPILWSPCTPPNPPLHCNCDTFWSPHHIHVAPWQSGTITLITPEMILAQGFQKGCWGPQRVWQCMLWSRACLKWSMPQMQYRGPWTFEGVGEPPWMWNSFRRSGKCLRLGGMGLTIESNYLRRGKEWLRKYWELSRK